MDNGCSHYIIGNIKLFLDIKFEKGGSVTFGDNSKDKVIEHGTIGTHPKPIFHNGLLVVGLKHCNIPAQPNGLELEFGWFRHWKQCT
ncbi:hypothetical protein LINPERPRIM_LOCUS27909 [Linum perenne]